MLGADGQKFDKKGGDFDIVEAAVYAVAGAKPKSPVLILADGTKRATAFAPTDRAFRQLVEDLTGKSYASEEKVFTTLASLVDIDTLETVLLYHVVPGATITAAQAVKADGAKLTTAAGVKLKVKVKNGHVMLVDKDPDAANATVIVRRHQQGQQADRPRHRHRAAPDRPLTRPSASVPGRPRPWSGHQSWSRLDVGTGSRGERVSLRAQMPADRVVQPPNGAVRLRPDQSAGQPSGGTSSSTSSATCTTRQSAMSRSSVARFERGSSRAYFAPVAFTDRSHPGFVESIRKLSASSSSVNTSPYPFITRSRWGKRHM